MQAFRRERNSVSALKVHLVCVTKYRRQVFDSNALSWLQQHAKQVLQKMDCKLMACDGEADHLHLLVEFPPKLSVSAMVNALKGTSSWLLRQARPDIAESLLAQGCPVVPVLFRRHYRRHDSRDSEEIR
jgi:REP element-mobilizing transposase RayT